MSVKKLLVLAAASVATTAAFAGGPDAVAGPAHHAAFQPNAYVNVQAGYDAANWVKYRDNVTYSGFTAARGIKNGHGGFAGGFDVGYQFDAHWVAEFGLLRLPEAKEAEVAKITRYAAYVALGTVVPLFDVDNVDFVAKIALVDRYSTHSGTTPSTGHYHSFIPGFAAGVNYHYDQDWDVGFQWMHIVEEIRGAAAGKKARANSPADNLFTLNVGYHFAV